MKGVDGKEDDARVLKELEAAGELGLICDEGEAALLTGCSRRLSRSRLSTRNWTQAHSQRRRDYSVHHRTFGSVRNSRAHDAVRRRNEVSTRTRLTTRPPCISHGSPQSKNEMLTECAPRTGSETGRWRC